MLRLLVMSLAFGIPSVAVADIRIVIEVRNTTEKNGETWNERWERHVRRHPTWYQSERVYIPGFGYHRREFMTPEHPDYYNIPGGG